MTLSLLDPRARLSGTRTIVIALTGVVVVAVGDYFSGNEISMSLFYLAPVGFAAWHAGKRVGVAIAIFSTLAWFLADLAAFTRYSHPVIPVWNALVRFGFFLVSALLLDALRNAMDRAVQLARTDALTGIFNRRAFEERLEHDLVLCKRRGNPVTIACVDLDGFKAVNDTHGHAAGDRVLRTVGTVMTQCSRRVDTAARIGGDEFAWVLPDTDADGAHIAMHRFAAELNDALHTANLDVTCSIGSVTMTDAPESPADALAAADALMYTVKRSGKGTILCRESGPAPEPEPLEA